MVELPYALFDAAPVGLQVVGRDWTCLYVNPAGAACVGRTVGELLGQRVWEVLPEAVARRFGAACQRVMRGGAPETVEEHDPASGRWHEIQVFPCPSGIAVHLRDITGARQREATLRRALSEAVHAGALGLLGGWTLDVCTGLITLSPVAEQIFQRSPGGGPVALAAWTDWFRPDDRAPVRAALLRAGQPGGRAALDVAALRPDASWVDVHLVGEAVCDADQQVIGVAGAVQDITARRHAEEERRRAGARAQHAARLESLARLAGGVAHGVNNVLQGVLGHVQLALCEVPGPEVHGHLTQIERAAVSAADLTRQLLAYTGCTRSRAGPVDMVALAEEMVAHACSVAPHHPFAVRAAPGVPPVHGDATQLREVLQNLLSNAAEAMGERHGAVEVRVAGAALVAPLPAVDGQPELAPGAYVRVDIVDEGPGLQPDALGRVFEPFFTTRAAGRGLGLSTALGVVRRHRGRITLQSGPSGGAAACVWLPAVTRAARCPDGPSPAASPAPAPRGLVLVVDDEPIVRGVTLRILRKAGYAVLEAASGAEALVLLGALPAAPDAAVLDRTMPGMDGLALAAAIGGRHPAVRLVLMTGYGDADTTGAAARAGVRVVLPKPFRADDLLCALAPDAAT